MDRFIMQIDGADAAVQAEIIDKKIWFRLNNETYSCDLAELAGGRRRRAAAAVKSADRITAPMPGKVTRVFVQPGQSVSRGDALLVMEAMKMEYTLKADMDALVSDVKTAVNDQVALGAVLVQLKEKG